MEPTGNKETNTEQRMEGKLILLTNLLAKNKQYSGKFYYEPLRHRCNSEQPSKDNTSMYSLK
jgi:hypothetical protein